MTKRISDAKSMNFETIHQSKRHVQCGSVTSDSKKIREECGVIGDEKKKGEECGVNGDDASVVGNETKHVGSGKVVRMDSCDAVAKAAKVLRNKGVIAIPTDTIYGRSQSLPILRIW